MRKIDIPSLHLVGLADPYLSRSRLLFSEFYEPDKRTLLEHEETHNVPSIRTGLYPTIKDWVAKQYQ